MSHAKSSPELGLGTSFHSQTVSLLWALAPLLLSQHPFQHLAPLRQAKINCKACLKLLGLHVSSEGDGPRDLLYWAFLLVQQ